MRLEKTTKAICENLKPVGAGESAYFELPTGSTSKIHMPDGTTKPATKI
ncbi:hypothetical protein AABU47_002292 [Listeria monocytogenes]|nr:hypothetical protein [Listeria monocytogenes]EGC3019922.1 hypothetical protein [Listeria monocytogenes]EGE9602383.1 hypothetical protein [Listeria monocytogenes]EHC6485009.1 hypothetical protein [Listeria monocytogenes]EHD1721530.1 hypothetical protein [Listeria monocytogenes]EHT4846713.1 hypothetical protein [Listeria monocytogenes]